jgi:hypothetical protein
VAIEKGEHPKRVYKPSGVNRNGERFEPYLQLNLWHHHLGRRGEPLLVVQKLNDDIFIVALTSHAEHFEGDKMMWLQNHMAGIDWSNCEDLREQVATYSP